MREVAVIGIGETKFGELWDKSFREIGIQAGLLAIEDSGIKGEDIDALYIGNMSSGRFIDQEHIAPLIADYVGLAGQNLPATRIEAAGASGGLALSSAYMAVASEVHDIVVVGGAEKMTDVSEVYAQEILASTADQEWESVFGATFAGLHAMMARRHMHEFGTTREQLGMVAVKNHKNAVLNPNAQYRRELSLDVVLRAPPVAEPLGLFDCAPLSDGAAALVLCSLDSAKDFTDKPVRIASCGQAGDYMALHDRRDICTMDATVVAANKAFKYAEIGPQDIDLAEVHDNYTISEILAIEDMGFFKKGEGGKATEEGKTALNSEISINPSGGLKARGQPVGATGVAQAVEVVRQLRGGAGERQVKDTRYGLTQNVGGTGASVIIHIFEGGI
ncbi:MAG: thiolase domain-containing protein [Thermoplasmata archaeon]|nr:MAG: thiolase domain-containing protein [Thermoplasmata archaeon]